MCLCVCVFVFVDWGLGVFGDVRGAKSDMRSPALWQTAFLPLDIPRILSETPIMSNKELRDKVTKEIALAAMPIAAAYLFVAFYEAGFAGYFGIPIDFIHINFNKVFLSNRLTLMVAVIAFLWIGLYYNLLPSTNSPIFKGIVTAILILALGLGFSFGRSDAKSQQAFMVSSQKPDQAVLKIYGDEIITAPFDRQTRIVKKQFSLHKVAVDPTLSYRLEKIGPLVPE